MKMAGPPVAICNSLTMWLISLLFQPMMGMESSTIQMILPLEEKGRNRFQRTGD